MPVGSEGRHPGDRQGPGPARRRARAIGRLAAALSLCGLTAFSTAPARAAASPAWSVPPAQATVGQVLADMDLQRTPVSYVILVDISGSMLAGGLFGRVQKALPEVVSAMNPGDSVAIDTFGDTAQTVSNMALVGTGAAADAAFAGLSVETHGETDAGDALALAYSQLYQQVNRGGTAGVGVVLLLSDGKPDVPAGQNPYYLSQIDSDSSPGQDAAAIKDSSQWQTLRSDFISLSSKYGMTVLGGGLALRNEVDLGPVVNGVFVNPYIDTDPYIDTLLTFVRGAQEQVQTVDATRLLAADNGATISASLSGPGFAPGSGSGSAGRGDVSGGTTDETLTLTSNSRHTPLVLTDAAFTSAGGQPVTVTGVPASVTVPPGKPVPIPVVLHWQTPYVQSALGRPVPRTATLRLSGTVASPWTSAITTLTGKTFAVGGLSATPMTYNGREAGRVDRVIWIVIVVAVLLLAVALRALYCGRHPRLSGVLDLSVGVAQHDPIELPPSRRHSVGLITVADQKAKISVRGARPPRGAKSASGPRPDVAIVVVCTTYGAAATKEKCRLESGESKHLCGSWKFYYTAQH